MPLLHYRPFLTWSQSETVKTKVRLCPSSVTNLTMASHFILSKSQVLNDLQDPTESLHTHTPLNSLSAPAAFLLTLLASVSFLIHGAFPSQGLCTWYHLFLEGSFPDTYIACSFFFLGLYSGHFKFTLSLRPFLFKVIAFLSHYLRHQTKNQSKVLYSLPCFIFL